MHSSRIYTVFWGVIVKGERRKTHPVQGAFGADANVKDTETKDHGVSEKLPIKFGEIYWWARRLTPDASGPPADSWDFIVASRWQNASMPREEFTKRLKECFEWLRMFTPFPVDIGEMLFRQAIEDRQMRAAYDAFNELLQSDHFNEMQKFILQELKCLEKCSALLNKPRSLAVPPGMSERESLWIGSLQDLTDTIIFQLRSAKESSEFMQEFLRMGRTDVKSYLLS